MSDKPTAAELAEWRGKCEALPPMELYTEDYEYPSGDLFVVEADAEGTCVCGTRREYAEFFVAARTAMPRLLDYVAELEGESEKGHGLILQLLDVLGCLECTSAQKVDGCTAILETYAMNLEAQHE